MCIQHNTCTHEHTQTDSQKTLALAKQKEKMLLKTLLLFYRRPDLPKIPYKYIPFLFLWEIFLPSQNFYFSLRKDFLSPIFWNSQCRKYGIGCGIIFKWVNSPNSQTANDRTVMEFDSRVEQCLVVIIFNNPGWSKSIKLSLNRPGVCIGWIADTGKDNGIGP